MKHLADPCWFSFPPLSSPTDRAKHPHRGAVSLAGAGNARHLWVLTCRASFLLGGWGILWVTGEAASTHTGAPAGRLDRAEVGVLGVRLLPDS